MPAVEAAVAVVAMSTAPSCAMPVVVSSPAWAWSACGGEFSLLIRTSGGTSDLP